VRRTALIDDVALGTPADRNRRFARSGSSDRKPRFGRVPFRLALAICEGQGAPARTSLCAAVRAGGVTLRRGNAIMFRAQERALGVSVDGFDSPRRRTGSCGFVRGTPNYRLERRGMDKVPGGKRMSQNLPHHCAHGFAGAAQPRR
jgi:hypothetical protein